MRSWLNGMPQAEATLRVASETGAAAVFVPFTLNGSVWARAHFVLCVLDLLRALDVHQVHVRGAHLGGL